MNKYEELVFSEKTTYSIYTIGIKKGQRAQINPDKKILTVKQDEDITYTKYQLVIVCSRNDAPLDKVLFYKGRKWDVAPKLSAIDENVLAYADLYKSVFAEKGVIFVVDLDFEDRISKVRFEYKNGIVEPIEIKVEYIEANKEAYYKKLAAQKRKELLNNMHVTCKTGESLVNVFWQNANNEVKKTLFELFLDDKQQMLIMKNELDSNILFKSVQGLAYGSYRFRLTQFDAEGNTIVETDLISFTLARYDGGNKGFVVI